MADAVFNNADATKRVPPQFRAGFTLIEILVALSIMVIVLGAAYGTFRAATKSVSRCRARTALEEDGQEILGRMAREIRCAYFPAPGQNQPLSPSPTPSETDASAALSRPDHPMPFYLNGTSGALKVLTTAGIADPDQPNSGLFNVAYRLDTTKKMLFRRQTDLVQQAPSDDDVSGWVRVGRGVESVAYSFGDGKNWLEAWHTDESAGLPAAVKIDLVLSDADGNRRAFSATVFIPAQSVPTTQTVVQPAKP